MPELALTPSQWCFAALAALCIGLAKSGFPGVGVFPILLLAGIMPARQSTGALLPLLICGDLLALLTYRRHAHWQHVWRLLPSAFIGIVLGFLAMPHIEERWFKPLIGWIVLSMVIIQYLRRRTSLIPDPKHRVVAWGMGVFSGVATMLANAAGPVMAIYLLSMGLPKLAFVGSSASFFLLINCIKVPFSSGLGLINTASLHFDLLLVPLVLVGVLSGRALIKSVPQRLFEALVLIFAAFAALRLILA